MQTALSLKLKVSLLLGVSLAGMLIAIAFNMLGVQRELTDGRREAVRMVVQAAQKIATHYQRQEAAGALSRDEAQELAANAIREMRFGGEDGSTEYFYIWTEDGVSVMHATAPQWKGKDMRGEVRDGYGRYTIRDLTEAAQRAPAGFVDAAFSRPGQTQAVDKILYYETLKPWRWVIGSGIYVDDIRAEVFARAGRDAIIGLLVMLAVVALGITTARSILHQIGGEPTDAMHAMERAADGDLTIDIGQPRTGSMLDSFGHMIGGLRSIVREIVGSSHTLIDNATNISQASDQVAVAARNQADATAAMAAAIEQMTVSINHISDSARDTEQNAQAAMRDAENGEHTVNDAATEIGHISSSVSAAAEKIRTLENQAHQISSITNVIKEIAAQTNLLALNAAIEAARAGEQGRGFAVVADEVRGLAERTSTATVQIEDMISRIQHETGFAVTAMDEALPQVDRGVTLAQDAAASLRAIRGSCAATLERIRDVALATREQSTASNAIAQQVESVAHMVEETSAAMGNTADSARTLENVANSLNQLVARFRY